MVFHLHVISLVALSLTLHILIVLQPDCASLWRCRDGTDKTQSLTLGRIDFIRATDTYTRMELGNENKDSNITLGPWQEGVQDWAERQLLL